MCFNTASVLIQLLFPCILHILGVFQYSFCSYSTFLRLGFLIPNFSFNTASVLIQRETKIYFRNIFQCFNTASVLIQPRLITNPLCQNVRFQYSFCSYSTRTRNIRRKNSSVSIQLLFLFNYQERIVMINKLMFQYSFCSYSTSYLFV